MSYYRARQQKRAELHLNQREAEQRAAADAAAARDQAQLMKSRAWLEEYHATQQPKDTSNAEEISEEANPQPDREGRVGEA